MHHSEYVPSVDNIMPLAIEGALMIEFTAFSDHRGINTYPWVGSVISQATGRACTVQQVNVTHSLPHTFRGIHVTQIPPGQAKYVSVLAGSCTDFLIDLREGSPTFLRQHRLQLSHDRAHAVFIPEGVGHGILCHDQPATIMYCCNQEYTPTLDITINPCDEQLHLSLPDHVILSDKDQLAPTLQEVVLPQYQDYQLVLKQSLRQ